MTDWHTSELSFLGRPRQIWFRFAKVVIHRLNFLLKLSAPLAFSVMAEYQPEEIDTSSNGALAARMVSFSFSAMDYKSLTYARGFAAYNRFSVRSFSSQSDDRQPLILRQVDSRGLDLIQ